MVDTPWMDIARAEVGTKEAPGPADNPVVLSYYAEAGHPEIQHDATPWCAAFVGSCLKRAGYPNSGSLLARSYVNYGTKLDSPVPGCVVVFWRNSPTSYEGHVAFFVRNDGSHIRVLGGNQADAVNEASFPKRQVLAYRMPIAPTASALQAAGSTEIPAAKNIKRGSIAIATANAVVEAATPAAPPPAIPAVDPSLVNLSEQVSLIEKVGHALNEISRLVAGNRFLMVLALCGSAWAVGWWWQRRRVAKHLSGQPVGVANA